MGGYSVPCPYCDRWFLSYGAIKDHLKGKHPDEYKTFAVAHPDDSLTVQCWDRWRKAKTAGPAEPS